MIMRCQDIFSIGSGLLENVFFSGVILGWPSLQYVLLKENYFYDLCNATNNVSFPKVINQSLHNHYELPSQNHHNREIIFCPERDATLNLVLSLAFSFQYLVSYIVGFILDKWGTWVYRCIASFTICLAYLFLAFSTPDNSWMVFLSMLLLSAGGLSVGISNIQMASLAKSLQGLVVNFQAGAFVSAAVVFLLAKEAYNAGITIKIIFLTMAALTFLTVIRTFTLMPKRYIPFPLPKNGAKYGWNQWQCFHDENFETIITIEGGKNTENIEKEGDSEPETAFLSHASFEKKHGHTSFKESLKSAIYWTNLLMFCIGHFRHVFFIGAFVNWVESFEKETVKASINAFNIIFLVGVVASPFCGLLFDLFVKLYKKRFSNLAFINLKSSCWIMLINSGLLVLLSALVVFKQTLSSVVAAVLSQFFVYGGNWTVLSVNFPMKHYGKLLGLTQVFAGVCSLCSYALFRLALNYDPSFIYVNIGLLVLTFVSLIHPITLYRKSILMLKTTLSHEHV